MKICKRFVGSKKAVSAVIGVILMVAITVAIVGVLWGYLGGLFTPIQRTPTIGFTIDEADNIIEVQTADPDIQWSDIQIKTDNNNAELKLNTGSYKTVGTTWTTVNNTNFGASGDVISGDTFTINNAVSGEVEVTFRYVPTNDLLATKTVNV